MEKALVKWLRDHFGQTSFARVGIGDDCAVLSQTDSELVLTCDTICDGVHFFSGELTPEQIGRKALAVNLSDLASMGATARTALVSLTLPRTSSLGYAQRLFLGMQPLVEKYGLEICGGDTTVWDGNLVVAVTALGTAPITGVWTVDNAKPGDQIVVTGSFGGSILKQHWAFEPRLDVATRWSHERKFVSACTDASDSLGFDIAKIAAASGVGFEIDLESVPIASDAIELAHSSGKTALQHALSDGEDFELIMAVNPDGLSQILNDANQKIEFTRIGEFTSQQEFLVIDDGSKRPFDPQGYEHKLESDQNG